MAGLANILHIRVLVGAVKYPHSRSWRSRCAQLVVWWVVSAHVHMCIKSHILLPSHWCQAETETGGRQPAQICFTRVQRYLIRLHGTHQRPGQDRSSRTTSWSPVGEEEKFGTADDAPSLNLSCCGKAPNKISPTATLGEATDMTPRRSLRGFVLTEKGDILTVI